MRGKLWMFVFLAIVAVAGSACQKIKTVTITGPSPTIVPSAKIEPGTVSVQLVLVNGRCEATQQYRVSIVGSTEGQPLLWSVDGAPSSSINSNGLATFTRAGNYTVRADAAGLSATAKAEVTGSCVGGIPGPFDFDNGATTCPAAGSGENRATLKWAASPGAVHYYVESRAWTGGPWIRQGLTAETSFTQTVRNDTTYYYRIIAVGNGGFEVRSTQAEKFVCGAIATAAPPPTTTPPGTTPPDTGTPTPPPSGVRTIQLTSSSFTGVVNATQNTGAVCRLDGVVVSCAPWWLSSDPSRVGVNPISGQVRYVFTGSASICVQWSSTVTSPSACATFTTQ